MAVVIAEGMHCRDPLRNLGDDEAHDTLVARRPGAAPVTARLVVPEPKAHVSRTVGASVTRFSGKGGLRTDHGELHRFGTDGSHRRRRTIATPCPTQVEAVIRDDPEALAAFRDAMLGKPGRPKADDETDNNVIGLERSAVGNSRAYSIARVQRECDPETVAAVMAVATSTRGR